MLVLVFVVLEVEVDWIIELVCLCLIVMLVYGLCRIFVDLEGDVGFGNLIVDLQVVYVWVCDIVKVGLIIVLMNFGGICSDLEVMLVCLVNFSEFMVIQFFYNDLVVLILSGV